ncbi:MAG: DNA polymerase III subunit delta [Patescibacteria group bacterium]|nr:DNA polymerase III subunit delta [Patescibacteria group bacterium]
MITTLCGPNSFGLQHDLHKAVQKFVAEQGDLALERIDGETVDLARLREAITCLPFLASKKLVVLRAPSANKQFTEQVEVLLGVVPNTTDIIIIEPKIDKRSAYYKFLKKSTSFTEYTALDSNGLAAWLVRLAKDKGGNLSSNDARYLIDRIGLNQQLLASELEKLLLHNDHITRSTIDLLTEASPQSTIFQLLEAAFAGHGERALQLYAEQRALKVEAPQIIAILAWQLHILLLIKTGGNRSAADVAKEARLSPYVVQKSTAIARNLSLPELQQLLTGLLDIDLKSKRSNLDSDEALQNYFLQLALSR